MSDLAHSAKHVVYGCPPNSPEQPRAAHLCGFSRTSLSPVSLSAASERRRQLLSAARRTPLRPAAPYSAPPRRARLTPSDSGRPGPDRGSPEPGHPAPLRPRLAEAPAPDAAHAARFRPPRPPKPTPTSPAGTPTPP